jgi:CRISPR system Cascade subunit CasD
MGKSILLLRLEGPLQSWGMRARWDVRDTQPEPTKSGIVGLLGCALGYPMYDPRLETELDAGLRCGVRVEGAGQVMEDYQTITDFLPTAEGSFKHGGGTAVSLGRLRASADTAPATIVSPRFYLQDAAFLVALEERDTHPGLLGRCTQALRQPTWPIFLGRKCCIPTRPILEVLTEEYLGIEDALSRHPWEWLGRPREYLPPKTLTAFVEAGFDPTARGLAQRQDAVRTNPARQYGFRYVRRLSIPCPHHTPQGGG